MKCSTFIRCMRDGAMTGGSYYLLDLTALGCQE